jgi:ATP-dependent DNA helicase RecQ
MMLEKLLSRTLLLDIETSKDGKIRDIAAILNGRVIKCGDEPSVSAFLNLLDKVSADADFVLGHNLLGHDFPVLQASYPHLTFLKKPALDTLYLSPLAFPQNPYHRLVKDYKLVRSTASDPVEDAKVACSVFCDQWESFTGSKDKNPDPLSFYRYCFEGSTFNGFPGDGIASVFSALGVPTPKGPAAALEKFVALTDGLVCKTNLRATVLPMLEQGSRRPALAYCLAWLQVAGANSVLPPWVRYRFPEISDVLTTLRRTVCDDPACGYCLEHHNPEGNLERIFGYSSFREKPAAPGGASLQRAIVAAGMRDNPLLAILPTGGGKSLCYQLPALIRHRCRGMLTVVISPLQALMKDQVDNLEKLTRTPFAAAISGLLTPPERGEVIERIRLGDIAILYISPEQLRTRSVRDVLSQREIGCWVFDEAHCVSKWGHDFRPDYLYAARFIREFARDHNQPVPPVCCFTATAKADVVEDITSHFHEELGQILACYAGGIERSNLDFEVLPVGTAEKYERAADILAECLTRDPSGSAIVYAETRNKTEEIRDYLRNQGLAAEAFHAGLDPKQKRDIIDAFVAGHPRIICATNAFGMGIDKSNVRLVLHFEMPGSLENYIQEAGRAGRDGESSRCVLLYDPADVNILFRKGAMSEISKRDIERMLRALRHKKRDRFGGIVVTVDELLREDSLSGVSAEWGREKATKARTAIAWLERAGFLTRDENVTEFFQGKPLVKNLEEAKEIIGTLRLPDVVGDLWLNILGILFNSAEDRILNADTIAEALFSKRGAIDHLQKMWQLTPAQIVIHALHEMACAKLIDRGIMLTIILRPKGHNAAMQTFQQISSIEKVLLSVMQEEDPDADQGGWVELDVPHMVARLKDRDLNADAYVIQKLLKGIAYDGKGFSAGSGSLELQHLSRNRYRVRLQCPWQSILKTTQLRRDVAFIILKYLFEKASMVIAEGEAGEERDFTLSVASTELSNAINSDIALRSEVKNHLAAIDHALLFLHDHNVVTLQGGLAVLRQAMTIRLAESSRRRQFTKGDYKPLAVHYMEKRFQVHVMLEYTLIALNKMTQALEMVIDYFFLGRIKFVKKYFHDREEVIQRATTQEAYRNIVEKLKNPVQVAIVGSPQDESTLILAGPGSGKTTVVVHRCAFLLQVERIPPRQILVLCFNHSAAVSLLKRLNSLVGKDAQGVLVTTYHGAAMRILALSARGLTESTRDREVDFDKLIVDAVKLLKGEIEIAGVGSDEVRDQILGGYSHILVDEYQDIDQAQYDLVSAIAGRTLDDGEGRLSILAVGDDDQNIYSFRGANVKFIRKFQEDYPAKVAYLVENYRSTKNIINASNQVIRQNLDRMKVKHPIIINRDRLDNHPGGRWELMDPAGKGMVQIVSVRDAHHQAKCVNSALERWKSLASDLKWDDCAVLSRTKKDLPIIRSALERAGYPVKILLERNLPLHRIREFSHFIRLLDSMKGENKRASGILTLAEGLRYGSPDNPWWVMLEEFVATLKDETADAMLPVSWATDAFFDFVAERKREKFLGSGLFLGTIHSTKGMEFAHVLILDGDWSAPTRHQQEEERRTLYVGMTRAKETLTVFHLERRPNPLLRNLKGNFLLRRIAPEAAPDANAESIQYEILGLNDVYMDYAGSFHDSHAIHGHLRHVHAGGTVSIVGGNSTVNICDAGGHCVGKLSSSSSGRWQERLSQVREVRVVAMIERDRLDPKEPFRDRIQAEHWEVPVVEVIFCPS